MSKKLFIIEDDANILYSLEANFSADGLTVETHEGEEELEEIIDDIIDFRPDYLILDVILPNLDGFEIIKRIKNDAELVELPIFIFSDISDEDSRARTLEIGADYFFPKDEFDTYEFAEKVKKIMANSERLGEDTDDSWNNGDEIMEID
ncbi:response regulator [Candidatus Falkowbacteria bacterium]|nr:response regulator [Patescibacteria group bacterium]MDD3434954.1 response regulator [Patescibacteria group bacterium]MDD4466621.1 response regulator [Patescibacteria group bacterium]NCU43075.1 response regulator [Candidatus Falkowbacteria bacterium]